MDHPTGDVTNPVKSTQLAYLTVEEVAGKLRVGEYVVLGMLERGELPCLRVGKWGGRGRGVARIPHKAFERWELENLAAGAKES